MQAGGQVRRAIYLGVCLAAVALLSGAFMVWGSAWHGAFLPPNVPGVYAIHLKFGSGVLLNMDTYRWTVFFLINGAFWFFLGVALGILGLSPKAMGATLTVIYLLLAAAAIPFLAYAVG